ncbi:hypothetical protein CLPUN_17040 [Clostridium puniceum]|uniref:Uncharacterized protein n=1 Tax=Clostridium puniceum TaxID=29367 RepID=A0A1S8TN62_9CLOT|nr:transcriptional regulator [Clostridium puniceum]OOM79188.1 hypothetical protein CLPUN_17040 [Clostridium puniceum]
MQFKDMTPHELAQKTIEDISKRRKLTRKAQKEALNHSMENRNKIQRKMSHSRY